MSIVFNLRLPGSLKNSFMARFEIKILTGFLLTLIIFSVLGFYTYLNNKAQLETNQMVAHTNEVLLSAQTVLNDLLDAETGQRGYVISGQQEFLEPYLESVLSIDHALETLLRLTSDNPAQQAAIKDRLAPLIDQRLSMMRGSIEARKESFEHSRDYILSLGGVRVMDDIRIVIKEIQQIEEGLLERRTTENERKVVLFHYTYIATGGMMVVILLIMFYVIYKNLKKRAQAERDLQQASAEIKDLYDHAPCGYFSIDANMILSNINQTLLHWLGYNQDEVVGKMKYEDLLSGESSVKFIEEDFAKYKKQGYINDVEFEFRRKDGTILPVIVNSAAIFNAQGEFVKTLSTAFDNTGRKKAEDERDNFFYNSLDLLVILSLEGDLLRWNTSWKNVLGYRDIDLENRNMRDLLHPDDIDKTFGMLTEQLAAGEKLVGFENRFRAADGTHHWLLWNAVPIVDKGIIYGFARDITERKRNEEKIRQLNHELEAFTYSVSHDLRSPLRSIAGYAQILQEDYHDKLDEEGFRIINVVTDSARRMGQLIDDLLNFSQVGRKDLSLSTLNMREMVERIVKEQTVQESGRPLNITVFALKPSKADASMLYQVWTNLISNAFKYSRKKALTEIEIGSYDEDGRTCYYISDKGAGFDMQYIGKLFGVFQRLHKTNEFEGTGVGLALVKRIIERHGGSVWAESKLNEGATFSFSLPSFQPVQATVLTSDRTLVDA